VNLPLGCVLHHGWWKWCCGSFVSQKERKTMLWVLDFILWVVGNDACAKKNLKNDDGVHIGWLIVQYWNLSVSLLQMQALLWTGYLWWVKCDGYMMRLYKFEVVSFNPLCPREPECGRFAPIFLENFISWIIVCHPVLSQSGRWYNSLTNLNRKRILQNESWKCFKYHDIQWLLRSSRI
jgi:hypothetical protein